MFQAYFYCQSMFSSSVMFDSVFMLSDSNVVVCIPHKVVYIKILVFTVNCVCRPVVFSRSGGEGLW